MVAFMVFGESLQFFSLLYSVPQFIENLRVKLFTQLPRCGRTGRPSLWGGAFRSSLLLFQKIRLCQEWRIKVLSP